MEEPKDDDDDMSQRALYVREMAPYYLSAEQIIQDMAIIGMISKEEAIRRRASLLTRVTGIVISVSPEASQTQAKLEPPTTKDIPKSKTAVYAPSANIAGPTPGNLPIKGATLTPVVDDEGFCSARSIATALGEAIKPVIVGKMARALGIYGVVTDDNQWGFFLPLTQNNKTINDNWRYSKKSQAILMSTLTQYIEKKRAASPRTRAGEVIVEVVANWPGYPLPTVEPVAPAPN
jgi:hypothetical protein